MDAAHGVTSSFENVHPPIPDGLIRTREIFIFRHFYHIK